jgi:hypothetical protein
VTSLTIPIEARSHFDWPGGNQYLQRQAQVACGHVPFLGVVTTGSQPRSVIAGATLTYHFENFGTHEKRKEKVIEAFGLWNHAVAASLGTSFVHNTLGGPSNIRIINDPLSDDLFGNSDFTTTPSGRDITGGFVILNNSSTGALTDDNHYLKAALHEIGHFMGLDDIRVLSIQPQSVMKYWSGINDPLGWGSWVVMPCDAKRATEAAHRPWP